MNISSSSSNSSTYLTFVIVIVFYWCYYIFLIIGNVISNCIRSRFYTLFCNIISRSISTNSLIISSGRGGSDVSVIIIKSSS